MNKKSQPNYFSNPTPKKTESSKAVLSISEKKTAFPGVLLKSKNENRGLPTLPPKPTETKKYIKPIESLKSEPTSKLILSMTTALRNSLSVPILPPVVPKTPYDPTII